MLHNIRSCYNVGAILRTCEGLGVKKVILSGYTPKIDDKNLLPHLREKLNHEIHKTALGAEEILDICVCDDILLELKQLKDDGWQVVGLENNINEKLYQLGSKELGDKLGSKIALVLGEEVEGIDNALYGEIDIFVEIPMKGKKESFNVSVAAGIAMWGLLNTSCQ